MLKFSQLINKSKSSKFKISLDIHGVIDSMPDFFAFLTDSFIKNGAEIHIVTGGIWNYELESQLKSYGIKWTHSFSVYDYLISIDSPSYGEVEFPDGTKQLKFDNNIWDKTKGDYCRNNNISFHVDDTTIYNNYFTTPFARLWTHTGHLKIDSKDVRHLM